MTLYFITGNKDKFLEVQSIIGRVKQLDIDLPEIQEIDARKIIEAKLESASRHRKSDFVVEDTSLYLDCMKGLPGTLVKWFLKSIGVNGLYEIANRSGNMKARAVTIVGYKSKFGSIKYFEGSVEGMIVKPAGKSFGWDPIFRPNGYSKTFAQMSKQEKNSVSMRRLALDKLRKFLDNNE